MEMFPFATPQEAYRHQYEHPPVAIWVDGGGDCEETHGIVVDHGSAAVASPASCRTSGDDRRSMGSIIRLFPRPFFHNNGFALRGSGGRTFRIYVRPCGPIRRQRCQERIISYPGLGCQQQHTRISTVHWNQSTELSTSGGHRTADEVHDQQSSWRYDLLFCRDRLQFCRGELPIE
jgi:hypothetical protein